jgi:hypothetical protein
MEEGSVNVDDEQIKQAIWYSTVCRFLPPSSCAIAVCYVMMSSAGPKEATFGAGLRTLVFAVDIPAVVVGLEAALHTT